MNLGMKNDIKWNTLLYVPATLVTTFENDDTCLLQMYSIFTEFNGFSLSFAACSKISIPSGRGDHAVFIEYGKHTQLFSALSLDSKYDKTPIEDLQMVYGNSLIVKSSSTMIKHVDKINHFVNERTLFGKYQMKPYGKRFAQNPIVVLTKRLMAEDCSEIFQEITINFEYRLHLLRKYNLIAT